MISIAISRCFSLPTNTASKFTLSPPDLREEPPYTTTETKRWGARYLCHVRIFFFFFAGTATSSSSPIGELNPRFVDSGAAGDSSLAVLRYWNFSVAKSRRTPVFLCLLLSTVRPLSLRFRSEGKKEKKERRGERAKVHRHVSCRYKITEQVALRGWFSRSICAYRLASLLLSAPLPRPLQLYCLSLYLLYIFLSFNRSHFF